MSTNITFGEVPENKGGRAESPRNKEIADVLRSRPGEWALVAQDENNDGLAVRIRRGQAKSFREGIWEATSRRTEDDRFDIHARYIGEG
jgi:hypothetical protein